MEIGQSAELRRRIGAAELAGFAALSGGPVPRHVPGPMLAALVSHLLGVELPGPGTNYLKQDLAFPAPAPPDTELTARVEITRLRPESRLVDLWASCRLPDGTVVCEGRALVKAPAEAFCRS
ncbi:phosphate acetyltransferase [Oceanicola granulosus HTCC2516]|uniref:Phosphate acetyltransferase n=1 Tax=Oceanicola granulosus (strain ATCC BAA-861 / DSM 15982 / KCTC 12143 / HTCC2516) TaxID=314256 RepID=Q2CBN3_OCEGH|nr:hypothetical protein [Oceanicola granulosus]EAR50098.1 phosphate acetyltransferase [Oceanicola granulosus HTCC2516]